MKKILLSLATLIVVGGAIAGATIAFYNDAETSSGNIFTAGSIDLKVDHLKQTYNGMNCETCSLELFSSDGLTKVASSSPNATVQTGFPYPAVLVSNPHNNWVDHDPLSYKWVWAESSTSNNDSGNIDVEYSFERDFYWNGVPGDVIFNMALASDNGYAIFVNDTLLVDNLDDEVNYNATIQPLNGLENQFKNALQLGNNTLRIIVRNHAQQGGTPSSNPGGLLYYLSIENEACEDDAGFQNACRLWTEKDLEQGDTFFNFGDVKPGDFGTNVISLHVSTNDAYACLIVNDKDDQENNIYDPEKKAGDLPNQGNPSGYGELSNYLNVFTWHDLNNDGAYDPNTEDSLGSGSLASLTSIMNLDATNGKFLTSTTTKYIGLAWCAGDLTENNGVFECDASGMKNDAQSDSFAASLTAYAVQTRNNDEFECSTVNLDEELNS